MSKGERIPHSVVAAAREDGQFRAVEVRRLDGRVEVVWTRSVPAENQTWSGFAAECGLASHGDRRDRTTKRHAPTVVGLDSTGVAFYRINTPRVEEHETAAIVKMQAESLLPLPADQIEVAWRTCPSHNGNMDITIAAVRKEHLEKFVGSVEDFRPRHIFLSCEGMAKAWHGFFAGREQEAFLISLGTGNTQVCLVQNGLVTRAGVLDVGLSDVGFSGRGVEPGPPTGIPDRFARDVQIMLSSLGWDETSSRPLLVLSDGGQAIQEIVAMLVAAGLPAQTSEPQIERLKTPAGFGKREAYEYRTSLGLAMIALEKSSAALGLFDRVLEEQRQQKAVSAWRSVALAGAAVLVMLIALLATVYVTDVASAGRWDALVKQPEFQAVLQQQALVKTVARHRPDLLGMLTEINAGQNDGIVLDGLLFKKGSTVTLTGQADNMEQMWKFQANLRAQKGIKGAEIANAAPDSKTKKIKFTITFDYKEFTKKGAAL
ncbi:MAG TPA: hypothetical protein PKH24_10070 [Sedimentisphaerales bacterium]|jgi:hypothetical protein|nr:hypothetical protein [Sedimentisphaerales bacterium]HNU29484.1 hypothetical protein [Sedimentisphaerales bacterium]